MSDSMRPHRRQPTRLPCPWDSPGKNSGMGWHFLLQCMEVKSESEVVQLCPTLSDTTDCSLPGSSVHGIFQARVLEWGAIAFSMKGSRRQQIYLVPCPTHPPKEFVFSIWIKEVSGLKTFLNMGERKKSFMEICMSIYNVYLLASFQKHML